MPVELDCVKAQAARITYRVETQVISYKPVVLDLTLSMHLDGSATHAVCITLC